MSGEDQSGYYQTIAKAFLRRRGAPFFLSARDLDLIAAWEKKKIPLDAILEGIARAFEDTRRPLKAKGLGLAFCTVQVERAFAQHRDRRAGGRRASPPPSDKRAKVRREIDRYLTQAPDGMDDVTALLAEAGRLVSAPVVDEEALERLDEAVDALLFDRSVPEEGERARRWARREFAGRPAEETEAAVRTRLVKAARDKHHVPYVSLYYY